MTIKAGTKLCGLKPEILVGLLVAQAVYTRLECSNSFCLTEATGAKHSTGSLHYQGQAVDLRLPPSEKTGGLVQDLKLALGLEFDVVLESDHIHIEWQPK